MKTMKPFSLSLNGRIVEYDCTAVMGIINATTDSFYAASRVEGADIASRAISMIENGADMLDIGAYSSRPGAADVPEAVEREQLCKAVRIVRKAVGTDVPISVDTFRASVAEAAIDAGADIINDISGGDLDCRMFETVARLRVPYILMHMRGTPATMQQLTQYNNVVTDVIGELSRKIYRLEEAGVADIIVDPGFGFAKTLEQNYALMAGLNLFNDILGKPVLVGVSRKSMLTRLLGINADDALTPTAVLGALAVERGAAILRVHDPLEAAQSIRIIQALKNATPCSTSE
ncbi:MAG: dihydropteroate synthase [Muribaculaceae bacterium]|nr:dihydropteroate synthase [Muribaculaceae bacterium]